MKLSQNSNHSRPDEETSGAKANIREPLLQRLRSRKKADTDYTERVTIVLLKEEMEILDLGTRHDSPFKVSPCHP